MIDLAEGGVIEVINFNKHQEIDKIESRREKDRIRQQEYRERKRNELITRDTHVSHDTDKNRIDKNRVEQNRIEEREAAADCDDPAPAAESDKATAKQRPQYTFVTPEGEQITVPINKTTHDGLVNTFGQKVVENYYAQIRYFCRSKGRLYKDVSATARNWIKRDRENNQKSQQKGFEVLRRGEFIPMDPDRPVEEIM